MEKTEVVAKIKLAIPDAEIQVHGADCSFSVVVLSQRFEKMLPVKRQQQILACFSDLLGRGRLARPDCKGPYPRGMGKASAE
jgi:acid stress-induced BolA-like protein IbaG/YrbA